MYFCAVAGWFISEEKCDHIAAIMDGRVERKELPLGITKTVWTQKRCLNCKRRFRPSPERKETSENE